MKTNIFAINSSEDVHRCGLRDMGGNRAVGTYDVEDAQIRDIDEDNMPYEKLIANKFILFLGDNRTSIERFKQLGDQEKTRLLRDFKRQLE